VVNAHSAWFTLGVAALIILFANLVMARILHAHLGPGEEFVLEVMIVFVGFAIPIGLTLATLWPEMREIIGIVSNAPSKATPILLCFVSEELKLLGDRIDDTRTRGIDLEGSVVSSWVRDRCFAVASGKYLAADSLVPSRFLALYSEYLQAHRDYLRRTGTVGSVRVNLALTEELLIDASENEEALLAYEKWHADNEVELLHLEGTRAAEIARDVGLEKTIDTAVWEGELALLIEYPDTGATNLRLGLVDETSYRRCRAFLARVRDAAVPFASLFDADHSRDAELSP
jgi:hypothetical protein